MRTRWKDQVVNQETLDALDGTIKKWEGVVAGVREGGPNDCPLCDMYNNRTCRDCPVCNQAGKPFCQDTPYRTWIDHLGCRKCECWCKTASCKICKSVARKMLNWLITLRRHCSCG